MLEVGLNKNRSNKFLVYFLLFTTFWLFILLIINSSSRNYCSLKLRNAILYKEELSKNTYCIANERKTLITFSYIAFFTDGDIGLSEYFDLNKKLDTSEVAKYYLGKIYLDDGYKKKAINTWKSIPGIDFYFANMSAIYFNEDDYKTAKKFGELSLSLVQKPSKEKHEMYKKFCVYYTNKKAYESALKWCRLDVQALPNGWTHSRLSDVQMNKGNLDQALNILSMGLSYSGKNAKGQIYQKFGNIYFKKSKFQTAVDYYNKAISLDYNNFWLYWNLAKAYKNIDENQNACDAYSKSKNFGNHPNPTKEKIFDYCK